VSDILETLAENVSIYEILEDFPDLENEDNSGFNKLKLK
jgi:uncharacterized protein (DUF433 family)